VNRDGMPDLDGDGRPDLLVTSYVDSNLNVLMATCLR
jgi:hypothetical protein